MVPISSGSPADREEWAQLLRLAGDPGRETEFLTALLASCRRQVEAPGVALYIEDQGSLSRLLEFGEADFPARLTGADEGLIVSELPAGALAAREPVHEASAAE